MSLSVHLLTAFDNEWISRLKSGLDARIKLTYGSDLDPVPDYHVLIAGVPERKHLTASQCLHALIIPWSGLPSTTRRLLLEFSDIVVYNIHHNAAPAAETAFALMIAAAKGIVPIDRSLRANDWTPRYLPPAMTLLEGKTALILGYGTIGKRLAKICKAFGMNIMAIRRDISNMTGGDSSEGPIQIFALPELPRLLPKADVIMVCLPHTPETRMLIGEEELSLLRSGAIVVNIARGPIIDETALYRALRQRRIRAGLDVWYNYPKEDNSRSETAPSKFPFHELDNVVMTPHLAGHSDQTESLRIAALTELLNNLAAGKKSGTRVDIKRGY